MYIYAYNTLGYHLYRKYITNDSLIKCYFAAALISILLIALTMKGCIWVKDLCDVDTHMYCI